MQTAKMTTMLPSVSALQSRPQLSCSRRAVMCVRASTSDDSAAKAPGQQPAQRSGRGFIRPDDAQPQPTRVRLGAVYCPYDSADLQQRTCSMMPIQCNMCTPSQQQPHGTYQPILCLNDAYLRHAAGARGAAGGGGVVALGHRGCGPWRGQHITGVCSS